MVYNEETFKPGVLIYLPGISTYEGQKVELFRTVPDQGIHSTKRSLLYSNTPVLFLDVIKEKSSFPPKYLVILHEGHVWSAYNEGFTYGWPSKNSNKRPNWTILKEHHLCLNPDK